MKKHIAMTSAIFALTILFSCSAFTQSSESKKRKTLRITGKVAVFLAKFTAKAAYETVKFTGEHVVVPAFKNVAVPAAKAAPGLAKNAFKLTSKGIKKSFEAISRRNEDDEEVGKSTDQ